MADLHASGTAAAPEELSETAVAAFAAQLRGGLIRPGDADYDTARKVYNGMIDRHPRLIARCADVADVIATVKFARAQGITLAIRGGGHNAGGLGIVDDGLVLDLAGMRSVHVDPVRRTARVEGGCTWADVDHATHAFGLATPSGFISTTGVGGLTLGGGIGYLTRKYGLTIDNLLAVDLVLADGRFVSASADENADLFWAVRGGGGNFGVVTSFVFRLHPVDTVYGGPLLWPLAQAEAAMRFYRDYMDSASEDISGFFAYLKVPPGAPFPEQWHNQIVCGVVWCYTGPMEQAEEVFRPIRAVAPPAIDFVGLLPFPVMQSLFDAICPPGMQWYWKADFVNEITDDAIALHVAHGSQLPSLQSTMHLYPISGASGRVRNDETAFSYREAKYAEVIVGVDPDPANNPQIIAWAKAYWEALHPHSAGGAYINFLMEEGSDRIKATYRENYSRLATVKQAYDPDNFFHVNQNIVPAGATAP